jgi:hypothetical protein
MAVQTVAEATTISGVERVHPDEFFQQMTVVEITRGCDPEFVKLQLPERQIDVPAFRGTVESSVSPFRRTFDA